MAAMLQVGFNLLYLRPGEVGGSEIYCRELIRHVAALPDVALTLFCGAAGFDTFEDGPNLRRVKVSERSFSQRARLYDEHVALRGAVRRAPVDVLHAPASGVSLSLLGRLPQVVTVHDLQHHWLPDNFGRATRAYRTATNFIATRAAARIIAISEFTRRDIIARYGAAPERVTTVLEGVDRLARPDPRDVERARAGFGLERPFFFYPAMLAPHKNHRMLFDAFARLQDLAGEPIDLVLSGKKTELETELNARLDRLGIRERVRHLGFVSRDDLLALMTGAVALLFPSRFEGFGLPPLEAMQCGTPVVASRGTAVDEVAGEGAVRLDPDDSHAWADAAHRLLRDETFRARLVAAGKENIERFSWTACAEQTAAVYREVVRAAAAR